MEPCCISSQSQQRQVSTANAGNIMTQGPRVPVAVPIQAGGGMVPVQTIEPGAQGGPLQLVTTPVSGADGYQPQMVQAVAAEAMTTGNQPLQVDMPPPYEEVEYNMPPPYEELEYMT
ncbi:uncharacterized protein LOC144665415 [Oculina patagonica]